MTGEEAPGGGYGEAAGGHEPADGGQSLAGNSHERRGNGHGPTDIGDAPATSSRERTRNGHRPTADRRVLPPGRLTPPGRTARHVPPAPPTLYAGHTTH
ncbi:two-component sensor histidine kinase, partial [Streptomyces albidoflavus]